MGQLERKRQNEENTRKIPEIGAGDKLILNKRETAERKTEDASGEEDVEFWEEIVGKVRE